MDSDKFEDGDSDISELVGGEAISAQTAWTANATPKPSHSSRDKRKRMKSLPTFASADEYAKLLASEEGEDIGSVFN